MKDLIATSLRYENGRLLVLDQRLLPAEESWHICGHVDDLIELMRGLAIRGAPLIGIAASLWAGHIAEQGADRQQLTELISKLRTARPTAVNLMNYLDRLQRLVNNDSLGTAISDEAVAIFEEDVELCKAMSVHGAALVQANARLLTHCNTGSLATAGVGTALGVITTAHRQGKNISVWVDETRPLLQGGRLTSWELQKAGVPYQLICDSAAGSLMAAAQVDMIFVGADRIVANGDFANKVGTYALAVMAKHHNVPFYVVAPVTTIDPHCSNGNDILIEQRSAQEVRGVSGSYGECRWAPIDVPVYNPAFDVTPAALVTGWVLDSGVLDQNDVQSNALENLCRG
jgi:methylthioribose-1-phosphate isomerase